MRHDIDGIKSFTQLVTMILIDILLIFGVIKIFFGIDNTIIAGLIGFLGAVVGGIITFIGVRVTIRSRDEEIFLEKASQKIFFLEDLISDLVKSNFNKISLYPIDMGTANNFMLLVNEFRETLDANVNNLKEIFDYDELSTLLFYKKTLDSNISLAILQVKDRIRYLEECREKIREILGVLTNNKETLTAKYHHIKGKRSNFKHF